jgi:hypothetical protein
MYETTGSRTRYFRITSCSSKLYNTAGIDEAAIDAPSSKMGNLPPPITCSHVAVQTTVVFTRSMGSSSVWNPAGADWLWYTP